MSDQEPGHQAITKDAVHALFSKEIGLADSHGLIRGITENEYYDKVNIGQKHQDRPWDAPTDMPGPTTHPWWANPGAQKDHFLALPGKTGVDNLSADRERIVELMVAAMKPQPGHSELMTLGAAMHGLQDSYSSAHVWRALSVYFGDFKAPVQSINIFDPLGIAPKSPGVPWTEGTHDPRFDKVIVDQQGHVISGSAVAAARGTLDALIHYERALKDHLDTGAASTYFQKEIETLCPAAPSGVEVNTNYGSHGWRSERDHRMELEQSSIGKVHIGYTEVLHVIPHSFGGDDVREHGHQQGHDTRAETHQPHGDQRAGHGHAGDSQTSDAGSAVSRNPMATSVTVPFNLHLPVPHLQAPHVESGHPALNLKPPVPQGGPGPFDFNPPPPAHQGSSPFDVPPVHLGPHGDWTPLPHPDPPSGEANPGNAERATDHSRRDPEDAASDSLAQAQIGITNLPGTFALGLHPDHGQKGEAEAAPHGTHPASPHDPHQPPAPPTDPGTTATGTTGHPTPFDLHLPVPELHIVEPGAVNSQGVPAEPGTGVVGHDAASSLDLHRPTPAGQPHDPGAVAATSGHGSGIPFNLELDPSAEGHGQGVHGFDLQLHRPGADAGDASHAGANPFNLQLDVSSLPNQPGPHGPSDHPAAAHHTGPGTHGEPHDHSNANQAGHTDHAHPGDGAHVVDVGHGGSG